MSPAWLPTNKTAEPAADASSVMLMFASAPADAAASPASSACFCALSWFTFAACAAAVAAKLVCNSGDKPTFCAVLAAAAPAACAACSAVRPAAIAATEAACPAKRARSWPKEIIEFAVRKTQQTATWLPLVYWKKVRSHNWTMCPKDFCFCNA